MNPFDPEFIDVFFNHRPCIKRQEQSLPARKKVDIHTLIQLGTSRIRVGDRTYKVVVTEIEITK